MKLKFINRPAENKSERNKLRREGFIPAVMYQHQKEAHSIAVEKSAYQAIVRQLPSGRLSTVIFTLVDEKGKEHRAILKEIQYHITNYEVIHLDFEELLDNVPVNIKVPIEFTGVVDCIGVKLGGVLRQVIRYLKVRCLPKDIPTAFQIDVSQLNLADLRRLQDLEIPPTVRPLVDLHEVAVVVVRR